MNVICYRTRVFWQCWNIEKMMEQNKLVQRQNISHGISQYPGIEDMAEVNTQISRFMGPTWGLSAPDGPHVGPMNLAIRVYTIQKMLSAHIVDLSDMIALRGISFFLLLLRLWPAIYNHDISVRGAAATMTIRWLDFLQHKRLNV